MWSILALGAIERFIHTLVDLDALTRIQFNQLEGQLLRVVIDTPQLSVDIYFDAHKIRLEPTVTGQSETSSIFEQRPFDQFTPITEANATLHVASVVDLLKLFFNEDVGNIPVQGDYHLLQNIQKIIQQAEPDLAAQLSHWLGPNLAHQIGKLQLLPKQLQHSTQSHAFFVEDFLKEDSGLFAPRWQMDDLQQDTRQLTQELDRLEAKIQHLQAQINPS